MARGKQTCKILKEIRRQIAAANGIEYATSECRHKGDCAGTCPKCEAEVRYLEEQLRARSLSGKRVMLAGVSAGMLILSGCSGSQSDLSSVQPQAEPDTEVVEVLQGDIECDDGIEEEEVVVPEEEAKTGVTELLIVGGVGDEEVEDPEDALPDLNLQISIGEIWDPAIAGAGTPDNPMRIAYVEQKPKFPGGDAEMYKWINSNVCWPKELSEDFIAGRVIVEFVVDVDGSIKDANVIRQLHPAFDAEALRVVNSMPQWASGYHNGQPVAVLYTLPITFKLR